MKRTKSVNGIWLTMSGASLLLACGVENGELRSLEQAVVDCDGVPAYSEGTEEQLVRNVGNQYRCDIPGWCKGVAWAYEPGVGAHWEMAWTLIDACATGGSGGSASGGASSGGASSGGASSGGASTGGAAGQSVVLEGTSNLTLKTSAIGFHHSTFDGNFWLTNHSGQSGSSASQLFFFASTGGYAFQNPSTNRWWTQFGSSDAPHHAGAFGWQWSAPLSHLVLRVDGSLTQQGGFSSTTTVPLMVANHPAPDEVHYSDDINIGVQGPLEVLQLADGTRWVGIVGTVTDMTYSATSRPAITGVVRDAFGTSIVSLTTAAGHNDAAPVRKFLAWATVPHGADPVDVEIQAQHQLASGATTQVQTFPLQQASPLVVDSPVEGEWKWSNGPGQTHWHAHSDWPEMRYGYDLGIHQDTGGGVLRSYSGDPSQNESYFCWGQPIYAVQDGTVVQVYDLSADNTGNQQDKLHLPNNEITLQHSDGTYSRYSHMIQGSALVTLGQQVTQGQKLAEVGNAGSSSEPHLHFTIYRLDQSGRVAAVPFNLNGLKDHQGNSVTGVPRGAQRYQTGSAVCTPQCSGRECGDDSCGGSCGTCGSGEACNVAHVCESEGGGDCGGLPQWQQGVSLTGGAQVRHAGKSFECRPWPYSGWCDDGGAYEPGVGFAWGDAWIALGDCQ